MVVKKSLSKVNTFAVKLRIKNETNQFFPKSMSLKTRGSEKVPHSERSYSRLIFFNQLIKYSVFGISLSNYKYRRKNSHQSITVRSYCRSHLTLFISQGCADLLDYCLTDCYFHRTVCKRKNIWRNLTISQYFRPVHKMGPKPGNTSVIVK